MLFITRYEALYDYSQGRLIQAKRALLTRTFHLPLQPNRLALQKIAGRLASIDRVHINNTVFKEQAKAQPQKKARSSRETPSPNVPLGTSVGAEPLR
jgi:hypothetical protein